VLLLESLARALQPLLLPDDAATRFEPLKRLALHLAMELVRTELTVSPRVVEGLVMRSVQALQAADEAPLTVELHPQDLALLQQALNEPGSGLAPDAPLLQRVNWKEDPQLTRGSVRARSDVSTVEDLIQHRLASIIQDLRIQTLQWQQDEAALQQKLQEQLQAGGGDA
jgi:flagellar biosynthesis/type III secretory pathway protein FliH